MSDKKQRAATQAALNKPEGQAEAEKAAAAAKAAEEAAKAAEDAAKRQPTSDEQAAAEDDELYAKALAEKNGYTLVPENKVANNPTVKRVGKKVYPNGMVIAERL